jgi:hypothetical protein
VINSSVIIDWILPESYIISFDGTGAYTEIGLEALSDPLVAVMVTEPAATATMIPLSASTVAIVESLELNEIGEDAEVARPF